MSMEDIIYQHCGDIRFRIKACRSKKVAELLKDRLCRELSLNCESDMVNNVLQIYVDNIIANTFDDNGKNKYLEA